MGGNYVLRPEVFGATVYHPDTTGYFFINKQQFNQLVKIYNLPANLQVPFHGDETTWDQGRFEKLLSEDNSLIVRQPPHHIPVNTLAAPVRIYFELTTRCNLRCGYCLNNSGKARDGALDSDEIRKTIRNLGRDGVFEVRLTGGEVSLLDDFVEFGCLVKESGMSLTINSNLSRSRKTTEDILLLSPNLLITSLDANEFSHKELRGPGYQHIVDNIIYLRSAGIPTRINCSLNKHTLKHIGEFIDEFAQYGCDFCFILLRPVGRASHDFDPPIIEELMTAITLIEEKQRQYPDTYISTSFHVVMEKELIVQGINMTGCNAIQKSFNINSDGSVLPCAFLYELSKENFDLGNIRDYEYSVIPIWQESNKLQQLRKESAEINARCINCQRFKNDCLGSCVFMDLYARHTDNVDPYCQISIEMKGPCIPGRGVAK